MGERSEESGRGVKEERRRKRERGERQVTQIQKVILHEVGILLKVVRTCLANVSIRCSSHPQQDNFLLPSS